MLRQRISNRIYFIEAPDSFKLVISNDIPVFLKYFFLVMSILVLILTFVLVVPDISLDDFVRKPIKITSGFLSILACLIWLNKHSKQRL